MPVPLFSTATSLQPVPYASAKPALKQTARLAVLLYCSCTHQSMRVATPTTRLATAPPPFLLLLSWCSSAPRLSRSEQPWSWSATSSARMKEDPAAANSTESDGLGRFAVDEHNKHEVSGLPRLPVSSPSACGCSVICFIPMMILGFIDTSMCLILERAAGVRARGGGQRVGGGRHAAPPHARGHQDGEEEDLRGQGLGQAMA
ncbi:hypothetical protein Zm00014a_005602 [Zea mays]|uniref:Uncharacterized protein n=1 Tax=Zea mays TaxID=4577 RepID=A0A3L6FH70_MAIZE|nr:hypothetical protein Zm00014a_005602 [Zea mays]